MDRLARSGPDLPMMHHFHRAGKGREVAIACGEGACFDGERAAKSGKTLGAVLFIRKKIRYSAAEPSTGKSRRRGGGRF